MLAHENRGDGLPLLLIHAFPLSRAMWSAEMDHFSRSARVIAPDLPGFGSSARQTQPSVPEMARSVADLLDQLDVREPVVACGLSMGGYVAFELLRQFPGRVRGLGLFSTRAAADAPEAREGRFKTAEKVRADGTEPLAKAMLPKLLGKSTLQRGPQLAARVTGMIRAANPDGVADALVAMAHRRDSTGLLAGIRFPVLVVAGDEDPFIPLSESRAMAAGIPGAELAALSGAGHLVNLEQPEAFRSALDRFLRKF